jgi:hypothetical protein
MHAPERVEAIRTNAAAQMKVVSELEAKIQDAYFQQRLQLIRNRIGDVDRFFLQSLAQEPRTPEQESAWLADAEQVLYIASLHLEIIQDSVAKYGPNVTAVGR